MIKKPNNPKTPPTRKDHDCIDYIAWYSGDNCETTLTCTICERNWLEQKDVGKTLDKSEWKKALKEKEEMIQ